MIWNILRNALVISNICLFASAASSQTPKACSNADLKGTYGFSFRGTNLGMKVSMVMMGRFEADGQGNFKGIESESVNGRVARGAGFNGTYTINPDCTGSSEITFEVSNVKSKMDFVLVDDGNEIFIVDVGGGTAESGEAKRQFLNNKK